MLLALNLFIVAALAAAAYFLGYAEGKRAMWKRWQRGNQSIAAFDARLIPGGPEFERCGETFHFHRCVLEAGHSGQHEWYRGSVPEPAHSGSPNASLPD